MIRQRMDRWASPVAFIVGVVAVSMTSVALGRLENQPHPTDHGVAAQESRNDYPRGSSATLKAGTGPPPESVTPSATPINQLGPWIAQTPLPAPRERHAVVVTDGQLYLLGGAFRFDPTPSPTPHDPPATPTPPPPNATNTPFPIPGPSFATVNTVLRASINADGSLGPWSEETSMRKARGSLAAVAAQGYLYAIGGSDASVERAPIRADGSLGAWEFTTSLPYQERGRHAAVAVGDSLYVLGGGGTVDGQGGHLRAVERAVIHPDGSLGVWESLVPLTQEMFDIAAFTLNGFLYALGGAQWVERAAIQSDGALGAWQRLPPEGPLPDVAAVAVGFAYAIGGSSEAGENTVRRIPIRNDGTLGSVELATPLLINREGFDIAAVKDSLYVFGGFIVQRTDPSQSVTLANVERAQIRAAPTPLSTPTDPGTPVSTPAQQIHFPFVVRSGRAGW